jgi:hypothetical protein
MNHNEPKHAKPAPPFRETGAFKTIALTAVTPVAAGLAATGGGVATHYLGAPHTDPFHNEPSGEWIRIEAAPTIGTAAVNHIILGPGD